MNDDLPMTGTCDLSTLGRRTRSWRRIAIWYVIVDGRMVVTGTPGARHWLANLRANPEAVVHLRDPARDLAVTGQEVTDRSSRRRIVEQAWRLQPWYAEQAYSMDDWVQDSPMVVLTRKHDDPEAADGPDMR
jgi:deazaflavin-dependent oxidoreductase (nitroreductase family)